MAGITRRATCGATAATFGLLLGSVGVASAATAGTAALTAPPAVTAVQPAPSAGFSALAAAQPVLRPGDKGPRVAALQRRLADLRYWLGVKPVDGTYGSLTLQAVYALQKAAGLSRDGVVGPKTWAALARGVKPNPRSSKGHLIEVDLKRQLLILVDNGRVTHTFNTSTGTNKYYYYDGKRYLADTPRGKWRVYRQIDGWRTSNLGRLYRPKYFHRDGIAVHGYSSVPPTAASHGCVRVSFAAIDWFWNRGQLPMGTTVWVY
jgi:peptidoglycan hydrolase-like protein with peptidoglycan-binding domain